MNNATNLMFLFIAILVLAQLLVIVSGFVFISRSERKSFAAYDTVQVSENDPDVKSFSFSSPRNSKKYLQFQVSSFNQLIQKARSINKRFRFPDLSLLAGNTGIFLNMNQIFAGLPTNEIHQLNIQSLSHKFSYYKSFDLSQSMLEINGLETVPVDQFPDRRNYSSFDSACEKAAMLATQFCLGLSEYNKAKDNARQIIHMIAWAVHSLLVLDCDDCDSSVKVDFERKYEGRRAFGELDTLFMCCENVVPILEASKISGAASFRLGAQLRAVMDQTLRRYRRKFPRLSEEQIVAVMEQYPTYGVITTAEKWSLVRYSKIAAGQRRLEVSKVLPLTVPLGRKPDQELLLKQIVDILGPLSALVSASAENAIALESQLAAADAQAAGGACFP